MTRNIFLILLLSVISFCTGYAQEESTEADSIEVFLIDSYVTPETPHKFILSFFTSRSCRSMLILDKKYEYTISDEFSEDHKAEIDVSGLEFDSTRAPFIIMVEDSLGNRNRSERYDVALPGEYQPRVSQTPNLLLMCCLGGIIFGLPSPTYVIMQDKNYFSLTKEIPILSFYKSSYKYPISYISVEYAHIFDAPRKNFFRAGYKHIFEIPYIRYVSAGANWFTDFKGFNGISPEVSLGLFTLYDVFTVYTKYRYNYEPNQTGADFHELSIGLYSGFFTFTVNL